MDGAGMWADQYKLAHFRLTDPVALAETTEGRVVGVVWTRFNQEAHEHFGQLARLAEPLCMVDRLAVLPTYRRSGIGRLLMHKAAQEARLRRCTHMTLWVDRATPPAERVAFFRACGLLPLNPSRDGDLYGADIETVLEATRSR